MTESSAAGSSPRRPVRRLSALAAIAVMLAGAAWFLFLPQPPVNPGPFYWPAAVASDDGKWTGRLVRIDRRLAILTVRGTPAERGEAHGRLLGKEVRGLVSGVRAVLKKGAEGDPESAYARLLKGAISMKRHLEPDVQSELDACAAAAGVPPDELVLAQLFGDVDRAQAAEDAAKEQCGMRVRGGGSSRAPGLGAVHGRYTNLWRWTAPQRSLRSDPHPAPVHLFCSSFAAFGEATAGGGLLVGGTDFAGHGLRRAST